MLRLSLMLWCLLLGFKLHQGIKAKLTYTMARPVPVAMETAMNQLITISNRWEAVGSWRSFHAAIYHCV